MHVREGDGVEGRLQQLVEALQERVDDLQQRVEQLERGRHAAPAAAPQRAAGAAASVPVGDPDWTEPYQVARVELGETWIEMHEPSARRHLHRMILEVLEVEGPVTEQLCLRRVREAWGVRRAGARIQQVFEQAVRQLVTLERLERQPGEVLALPGQQLEQVRVPAGNDEARRAVDEIPRPELELALRKVAEDAGSIAPDELTAAVARLFGWTRRGTGIQAALDERLEALERRGDLERDGAQLRVGAPTG